MILLTGDVNAEQDSNLNDSISWQVRKLDRAPKWHYEALKAREGRWPDTLKRVEYVINDSVTLVHYDRPMFESISKAQMDQTQWADPGSLYLCGRDTVLLDSNLCGYVSLSFDRDSIYCAAGEVDYITEDGGTTSIVLYDLRSREKIVVHKEVCGGVPQFAPATLPKTVLEYSDYGNMYVYYPETGYSELLFKGNPPHVDYCWDVRVTDEMWSPDGTCLVFWYRPGKPGGTEEPWEARWSRVDDSTSIE